MPPERLNYGLRFWALNAGSWMAIALLFAVQNSSRSGLTLPSLQTVVTSLVSFVPCVLLTPAVFAVADQFRFAAGDRVRSLAAHGVALAAYHVIGAGMMGALAWLLPWTARGGSIWGHATDAMGWFIAYNVLAYILVAAGALALLYSKEARERTLTAVKLEGQLAEARLHALSSQLQPHFLFNTLNAISALVREDPATAERLLASLSDLLRQALRDGAQPQTSLESELAFLEKYVEVQEARFGDRLTVTFDVDSDVLDARVPNLILQPLVENAIRHGIAPRGGPGSVRIAARRSGDQVTLSVSDDGLGIPRGHIKEGIGLRNTRARLRELYGDRQALVLANQPNGGTLCELQLPLHRVTAGADS